MKNFEIVAIFTQYKDTLDDFIDNSNLESLVLAGSIDKKSYNVPISKSSSIDLFKEEYLDENLLNMSSQLTPKIEDSLVRQSRVIAPQARYRDSQRRRKDCWGNKRNPVK